MKPGLLRWIFHRLIISSPLSFWALIDHVWNSSSASLSLVSKLVCKEIRVSLVILHEPCGEVFKWREYWPCQSKVQRRKRSVPNRDWFGWLKTCTWALCHPGLCQGCSDEFLNANSVRHEESQNLFPRFPKHKSKASRFGGSPPNLEALSVQMWSAEGKVMLDQSLM